ncbi:hypothetical protein YC2023_019053 [Brassica napus]
MSFFSELNGKTRGGRSDTLSGLDQVFRIVGYFGIGADVRTSTSTEKRHETENEYEYETKK